LENDSGSDPKRRVFLTACLGAFVPELAFALSGVPRAQGDGRHLLVVVELGGPTARIRRSRIVPRALRARRGPAHGWEVVVEDAAGEVLHRTRVAPAGVVRGEFAAPDGGVDAVQAADPRAAVRLRLPIVPGAATIRVLQGARGEELELARVPYPEAR
jgi:hypothetical protein